MNAADSTRVFANGIWKSGNNLLLKLLTKAGLPPPAASLSSGGVQDQGAFFLHRTLSKINFAQGIRVGLETDDCLPHWYVAARLRPKGPRMVSGHTQHSDELERLLQRMNFHTICIVRDPRDVLVSYAKWIPTRPDHFTHTWLAPMEFEQRIDSLLEGNRQLGFASFSVVLDRMAPWIDSRSTTTLRFEDLVGTSGGGSDEARNTAIAELLTRLEIEGDAAKIAEGLHGGTKTFRRGKINAWASELTADSRQSIINFLGANRFDRWGYCVE